MPDQIATAPSTDDGFWMQAKDVVTMISLRDPPPFLHFSSSRCRLKVSILVHFFPDAADDVGSADKLAQLRLTD